jgi:hypothetical protein
MAFSDFDLRSVVDTFGLREDRDSDLFAGVAAVVPGDFLRAWLDEHVPLALGMNTEQARRECIIFPVLTEARRRAAGPVTVFSGISFEADKARGLAGFCDYIIARSAEFYYLRSPAVAVVEAKREDVIGGLGQCAATMVGMRLFNEKDGTPVSEVYGCVTSGSVWRFLRLQESRLSIDRQEYHIRDVATVLGILVQIMGGVRAGDAGVAA